MFRIMLRSLRALTLVLVLMRCTLLLAQPLSGTYTVGAGGNYTTLAAAITALQTNGVSGPVFMNIFSGTYTGTWTVGAISGTSAVNRVVFRSQALDSTAVTLTTAATGPAVAMSACSYVSFHHVTIQALMYGARITTGASDCGFRNCRIIATSTTSGYAVSSNNLAVTRPFVLNCALTGSVRGIALNGPVGTEVIEADIRNNVITVATGNGITLVRFNGAHMEGNRIVSTGTSTTAYIDAITLQEGTGVIRALRNDITWGIGSAGIRLEDVVPLVGDPPLLANNMIRKTAGGAAGSGIRLINADGVIMRHNSIRVTGPYPAMSMTSADNVVIEGNVLHGGTAECVMFQTSTLLSMDRNIFFGNSGTVVHTPPVTNHTLSSWQATGRDLSSLYVDPQFVSATDLHLQATSPAISFGGLPTPLAADFDGQPRAQPVGTRPDAGADERPEGCTGCGGTYTIGTAPVNDFPTFTAAILAMANCGLTSPATFLVQSGTYTEQVRLPAIAGNNAVNTITFRSQALDSSAVLVQWPSSTTSTNDWVLRLEGADHVTFDRLTFERTGSANYASVVTYASTAGSAGSQRTRFLNSRLISGPGIFGVLFGAYANGDEDSVVVHRTRLQGGYTGLQWSSTTDNDLLRISENIFTGQTSQALSLSVRDRAFVVRDNAISITAPTGTGLIISNSTAGFDVHRNRVTSSYHACYLSGGITSAVGGEPRLYNNMFRAAQIGLLAIGGTGTSNLRIDNNTVYGGTTAISLGSGTIAVASLRNNVLVSAGLPLNRGVTSVSMASASHNALFRTTAGPIAFWTANQNTVAALQSASGQFASSVVANPLLFDQAVGDLHAYAMELDAAGTPIAHVTRDVDGQLRQATTPDIGADEFTPQLWAETFNTCAATDPITSIGSGVDQWIYKDRKVVARFNDNGQILGTVTMSVYVNNGPVRQSLIGQHFMDRNWHLVTQNPISSGAIVRLFHSADEFNAFSAVDPVVGAYADAGVAQYAGANENCQLMDDSVASSWVPLYPALPGLEPRIQGAGGTHGYTAVVGFDGEFYITSMGSPLPVELLSFTAQRVDERTVALAWTTATERDNAGFEVWRMIEGEEAFTEVGWVDGVGNSQQISHYAFDDDNGSDRTSYYRIVQVDFDGAAAASEVVPVQGVVKQASWSMFPNPARDRFSIQGLPEVVEVRLMDGAGRQVERWSGAEVLHLPDLASGLYLVQVRLASGTVEQQRLMLE